MRTPLTPGTLVRLNASECYEVTGPCVGEGGGSLIYPAVRWGYGEGLAYALKECFPVSGNPACSFARAASGEIVAERGGAEALAYLRQVKRMQLEEQTVTDRVYRTGFRLTPILSAVEEAELSTDGGAHFHRVENTYTVMESLSAKGRALREYLTRPHRISLPQALRITEQVLLALSEVHRAGYLHLDIQDGNVFLKGALEDGSDFASLIDFGSARQRLADGKCAAVVNRTLFSTPGFRAPEMVFRNDGTLRLGPEADLYSVGCLLLLLLTGQRRRPNELYNWKDRSHLLTRMNLNRMKCPRHLVEPLQALVSRALENEPEQRFHTAEEMLREVRALAGAVAPRQSALANTRYDAFICYRHGGQDSAAASRLQKSLESFRAPALRTGERGGRRLRRVFLDREELSSGADFEEQLHAAVDHSGWMIVICSPETPQSQRVRREIDWFLEKHDRSHLLAVLTKGEPEESFPPALLGGGALPPVLAADARGKTLGECLARVKGECLLRLAAPMLGTTYDTLRQRRRRQVFRHTAAALALTVALCAALTGLFTLQRRERALKLAEYAQNALEAGDPGEAVRLAMKGSSGAPPAAVQRVLTDALGVYELSDGFRPSARLELGAQPLQIALSPSGRVGAAVTARGLTVFDTGSGDILAQLPAGDSAQVRCVLPDEDTVLCGGDEGLRCWELKAGKERWTGAGATAVCVSGDGTRTAGVYRDQTRATVYDTATGAVLAQVDFGGRHQKSLLNDRYADLGESVFALNGDGSLLAVSFSDGSLSLFDVDEPGSSTELMEPSAYNLGYEGGFSGDYFAFCVTGAEEAAFAVVDTRTMEQTGGFQGDSSYHVWTDEEEICLQAENLVVRLDPESGEQTPLVKAGEDILLLRRDRGRTLTAARDAVALWQDRGGLCASWPCAEGVDAIALSGDTILTGSLSASALRVFRAQTHSEALTARYDTSYGHDEARISADGSRLMLFSTHGFQILDREGQVLAQRELDEPQRIYDQQFLRDDGASRLEVTWYDGTVVSYGMDGEECGRRTISPPSAEIADTFLTRRWRIESPLHGTPRVYDRKTGELHCELKEDAYLIYVTEADEGIVAQYMTADGSFYAQLLNQNCEVVAQSPRLCDVWDNTLYFDCPDGTIRQSGIYTFQELLALGRERVGGNGA